MKKILAVIMFAYVFLICGCNSFKVESIFKIHKIVIDGNDEDWSDAKYYIKKHDIVFGVMNDNDFLYLCFYPTTSELTRQVLSQGLTLWINNDAKRKKNYGIRFPLGMQNLMNQQMPEENGNQSRKSNPNNGKVDPKMMDLMVKSISKELEIISQGNEQKEVIKFADLNGVEIGIAFEKELFAYELKIPLADNPDFTASIGADPTSKITLGFEVPEPDKESMKEKDGMGDRPSDGRSGGGGGKGMGKGGMQGDASNKTQQSEQGLDIWTIIQLVEN